MKRDMREQALAQLEATEPKHHGSTRSRWVLLGAVALLVVVASGIWLLTLLPDASEIQVDPGVRPLLP